jgi:DNA-binding CsgD family transcriptional regulator
VHLALARAHLLYGEWLRRENRRIDAREQLRRAHQMLQAMGAEGFAERARRELMAAGQAMRKRTAEAAGELTAQEQQIALRAREGRTNAEIGAELFLSPRTVEWHMSNVFMKLGITSRGQLWHVLGGDAAIAVPLLCLLAGRPGRRGTGRQDLRPTPPAQETAGGPPRWLGSGRHCDTVTTPGGRSSRPSK